jgi:hypothetical protein
MGIGDNESTQHFRDYLFDLATSRIGAEAHGTPTASQLDESGDDEADSDEDGSNEEEDTVPSRARPVLAITGVSHRGDHVVIDYLYGRQLGYTHAGYSETNKTDPVPIADLKSVRPYRSVFMFPEMGEAGVVAVEDASRACAHKKLEQWLKAWARQDGRAEAQRRREETGKKSIRPLWWSARFTPLSNPEKLTRLMKQGTSSKIVLTKQGGSDARLPGRKGLKVEMGLDDAGAIAKARQLITKWTPGFGASQNAAEVQRNANRELAAVLAEQYEGFDSEEYDDAYIEVRDANGKPKQISPSRWEDIFIYPVRAGIECPPSGIFFKRVRDEVTPLQKSLALSIDWAGWGDDG